MTNTTKHEFTTYIESGNYTIPFNLAFLYNIEESSLELYSIDIVYEQKYRGNTEHYKEFAKILRLHSDYNCELEGKLEILCWEYLDTLD